MAMHPQNSQEGEMASGIHHVTAVSGPAPRNLAFYTEALGLRLVKRTVNFDDPGTWHLYYGDYEGAPGTLVTFFPWAHAAPGRIGIGETMEIAFRIPEAAIGYWTSRLIEKGVTHEHPAKRFGETVLAATDPDGMRITLVGVRDLEPKGGVSRAGIPPEMAIDGLYGVTLLLGEAEPTGALIEDVFGFEKVGTEETVTRYRAPGVTTGAIVDLRAAGGFLPGRFGAGSIHHVAFRAADDDEQAAMVERLKAQGLRTTEQKDRKYFRSVYFREPGRVLFEIATDAPGFAVDEDPSALGTELRLPRFLEDRREEIERALPPLG